MNEYHGQKIDSGVEPNNVPQIPKDYKPGLKAGQDRLPSMEGGLDACPGPGGSVYAHVRMTGNYGIGCPSVQSLDYYGITADEAHRYAWSGFGYCGHTIVYFDAHGQVVAQE